MMNYRDLRELRLETLLDAASDWREMADQLETEADSAQHDLRARAEEAGWVGESAEAGRAHIDSVAEQTRGAGQLAESVAAVLYSAIEKLAWCQDELRKLVYTASDYGLRVDEAGQVHVVERPATDGDGAPPAEEDPAHAAEQAVLQRDWQKHLDQVVTHADEADGAASRALLTALGDTDERHFTTDHVSVDEENVEWIADAQRVVDLAERDGALNVAEAAEVVRVLGERGAQEEFADYVADALGVEGLLELEDELSAHESFMPLFGTHRGATGVADVLATTTRVPDHLSDVPPEDASFQEWLGTEEGRRWDDLREQTSSYGMEPGPDGAIGYHRVLDLMDKASEPFSGAYLDGIAGDLLHEIEEDPFFDVTGISDGQIDGTLLDRTLDIASRNPDAATVILDPERDRLDTALQRAEDHLTPWETLHYDSPGLANAIEAASTGRPAGEPPSPSWSAGPDNARVAQHIMDYVVAQDDSARNGPPPFLVPQFGTITAEYIPEINYSIDKHAGFPQQELGGQLSLTQADAETVLSAAALDPESFETVMASQQAYAITSIDYAVNVRDEPSKTLVENLATTGGHVTGVMAHAQASQVYDEKIDTSLGHKQKVIDYLAVTATDSATLKTPVVSTLAADAAKDLNNAIFSARIEENEREASDAADKKMDRVQESTRIFYEQATLDAVEESDMTEAEKIDIPGTARLHSGRGFQDGAVSASGIDWNNNQ